MGLVVFFSFFHSFIQQNIALLSTIFQAESGDVTTKNKQNHGPFYGLVLIHKHNE